MTHDSRGARRLSPWLLALLPVLVALLATPALARKKYEGRKLHKQNQKEQKLTELGRRLFYDPLVSRTGTVACSTCHVPDHGFSDPRQFSPDETGTSGRHSQPILDTRENPTAHWDGEFEGGVEDLVTNRLGRVMVYYGNTSIPSPTTPPRPTVRPTTPRRPLAGGGIPPITPGSGTPALPLPTTPAVPRPPATARPPMSEFVAEQVEASGRYAEAFKAAYGNPRVTIKKLADAMGEYCHSIESTESPFDRFRRGDETAISESARRGHDLFHGRAQCASCHSTAGKHPLLTDYDFHNTGIAWRAMPVETTTGGDTGRMRFSSVAEDMRAFKTPTLRDLTRRGPFMHDGSFTNLEQVVRYYADGGSSDPEQDDRIQGFEASDQDVKDLVAFLETLTGDVRPGLAKGLWKARAEKTRLRFVNAEGRPVAELPVRLVPAGDWLPVDGVPRPDPTEYVDLVTDEKGYVTYEPLRWTHARLEVDEGLVEVQHPLIPDTLRKARVEVPVAGKFEIVVVAPNANFAPPRLALSPNWQQSVRMMRRSRGGTTTTVAGSGYMELRRISRVEMKDQVVAKYEGWLLSGYEKTELFLQIPGFRANNTDVLRVTLGKDLSARVDLTE